MRLPAEALAAGTKLLQALEVGGEYHYSATSLLQATPHRGGTSLFRYSEGAGSGLRKLPGPN